MQGLRVPLTLVSAPAGFGKTTLIASAMRTCSMPFAWLSLEKQDDQPRRFFNYLVAALQCTDPALGSQAAKLVREADDLSAEAVMSSLVNDLEGSQEDFALVLDDVHLLSSLAVHEALTFLLDHCPPSFHLVVLTRADPPLPLARLRARGQMVELRAADLRFTRSEAARFLNDLMNFNLDEDAVAALEGRTEGWVAGLQMAALSMQGRADVAAFINEFAGTNRFIMDYLLEEVLGRERQDVQDFLLQTSILSRLNGPLCDAVMGGSGSQAVLEELEERSLFLTPLNGQRCWYRYHLLFADLLQARLLQMGKAHMTRLYARAATWCEQEGHISEAVGYALAAEDYEHAATMIADYWGSRTNMGEIETVQQWLAALPEPIINENPTLSTAYCWMLWFTGQITLIEPYLADAGTALQNAIITTDSTEMDTAFYELGAEQAALRSILARYRGDFKEAARLAEGALASIPEHMPVHAAAQLRSIIYLALASACEGAGDLQGAVAAYYESIRFSRMIASVSGMAIAYRLVGALRILGRLHEAGAACRDILAYLASEGLHDLPAAGILHMAMSEVLAEQNDLDAAREHLARAYELGKWSGRLDAVRNAVYTTMRLGLAQGDLEESLAAVEKALSALGSVPSPLARSELLSLKARMLVRQGSLAEAAHNAEEAARLAGEERGQTAEMAHLAAARVMAARVEPQEAADKLKQSIVCAQEGARHGTALELHILRSLACVRHNNIPEALKEVQQALALAESGGFVRIFLDEGQTMHKILNSWLVHAGESSLRTFAEDLLSQFEATQQEGGPSRATTGLVEPISPRELEILQLMAQGRTNKEIAARLVISPGTVKAHTSSIYRKLDAANRTEAVARARQLGILD